MHLARSVIEANETHAVHVLRTRRGLARGAGQVANDSNGHFVGPASDPTWLGRTNRRRANTQPAAGTLAQAAHVIRVWQGDSTRARIGEFDAEVVDVGR